MFQRPLLGLTAAAAVALVIALGVAGYVFFWPRGGGSTPPNPGGPGAAPHTPGFRECARESGVAFRMNFLPDEQGEKFKVNLYDHGCGVAVGDYDGDGRDDIYFVNQLGRNALYRNKGDGTFEDVTDKARVGLGDRICVGAVWADYDNDGHEDLFVTSTRGGNVLFHNNGDGTFTDVTEKAHVPYVGHSQTAVFFDYDNDGRPDLFVTNTAKWTANEYDPAQHYFRGAPEFWQMAGSPKEHNLLYHNNGDGTFTDVTEQSGLAGQGWGGDVAVFDIDGDGYLDLFVTNMFGANQLYHNNGNGSFTDVTKEYLGPTSFGAIGSRVFDFNNDGRLDLLVVDMHSDMWLPPNIPPLTGTQDDLRKKYSRIMGPFYYRAKEAAASEDRLIDAFKLRYEDVVFGNTLFKQLPSGKFQEVSDKAGLETWWPWGVAVGDFDDDGWEDVFLPSGMGYPYAYWPNALMMNNGDETFTDRAAAEGIEPPPDGRFLEQKIAGQPAARSSRCAAVGDFDGDGRLDLVVNNFNDRAFLFRNQFPRKNYVAWRLTGTNCGRDAVGATVTLHLGDEVKIRQVQAAGGYLSQSSKTVHFGLGDRAKIDRAEIRWPRRGGGYVTETIDNPAVNTLHEATETKR